MKRYYKYNTTNGQIVGLVTSNIETEDNISSNIKFVSYDSPFGIDPNIKYHDMITDALQNRPHILCDDNIKTTIRKAIVIKDLPVSTKIVIDDNEIAVVDDGILQLTIPLSGTYTLKLIPEFPYIEKQVQVEVK